jgi:uncharacterized protein YydD (DUF2326 family)
MKLIKLYSNKPFYNITFITDKGGLNVVLGDASKQKEDRKNSHNLGKSKLAELLDFMLLKGINRKEDFFFYKEISKAKFTGYEFYLEILLNNGKYLTIKRGVDIPTKISFKLNDVASEGYILYEQFNENLAFDKAKKYLNDLLDFDFCKETEYDFRKIVNYCLRLQGDYEPRNNTIFQLSKFTNKNDKDSWRALIFSLLGFEGSLLIKKYELENEIKEGNNTIKAQEKDFGIKSEDKDSLVGKIQYAENEKETLSKELDNFNFYQQDKNTIQTLVGTIEADIALLNTQLYNLEYDIKKLSASIKNEFSFDLNRVKTLFEEVQLHFPNQLSQSYEQLINFNHQITQERNKQIRQTIQEKQSEKLETNSKLVGLNNQREQFRDLIQDTTLFKKYSVYQKKIVELEKELSRFQTQLEALENIDKSRDKIEEKQNNDLQKVKNQLKEILDNTVKCDLYMNIRKTFSEIVKNILNENALITIKPNANYNIEFKPEFPDSAKDDGATYYKILCVAFDLAVLINYRNKSHFRFVYHDDVISGDDNGVKSRLIDVLYSVCEKYDIQYIFSAVKDNIPPNQNLEDNIILELHDKDDSGKLFKMSF